MEDREDEVHQFVRDFLMKDVSNIQQNQTKPKHNFSSGGTGIKEIPVINQL